MKNYSYCTDLSSTNASHRTTAYIKNDGNQPIYFYRTTASIEEFARFFKGSRSNMNKNVLTNTNEIIYLIIGG